MTIIPVYQAHVKLENEIEKAQDQDRRPRDSDLHQVSKIKVIATDQYIKITADKRLLDPDRGLQSGTIVNESQMVIQDRRFATLMQIVQHRQRRVER